MRIAVFPGSFDPITTGHVDIVERALPLFDKIIVAIGINSSKSYLYSLDQRKKWLEDVFRGNGKIEIGSFEGLTAEYCKKVNAKFLLRGIRNAADFDYEKTISQVNNIVGDNLETVFLISQPRLSHVSSSIVREIIKGGGDVSMFLPQKIKL